MGIVYPGAVDVFNVPSLPEDTPLSEAGSASRNHTELHEDINSAVELLEEHAAFKDHDHSGDGTAQHGLKLVQAYTHEAADTDVQASSIHHTIGPGGTQAAAGNHVHDYLGNTILNKPLIICTSTTHPGQPFVGQLVFETDTSAMRVWTTQEASVSTVGLYVEDNFERASNTDLGSSLWEEAYTLTPGNGILATPDGHTASWITAGTQANRVVARRINSTDSVTQTDDQEVSFSTGLQQMTDYRYYNTGYAIVLVGVGLSSSNDVYLRMSSDRQSYIRVRVGLGYIQVLTTTSGHDGEVQFGMFNTTESPGGAPIPSGNAGYSSQGWAISVVGRTVSVYNDGTFVGSATDVNNLSSKGSGNRGWGFGMENAPNTTGKFQLSSDEFQAVNHPGDPIPHTYTKDGLGQNSPCNVTDISAQDVVYYSSTHAWGLLSAGAIPILRISQGVAQNLAAGTGGIIQWDTEAEDTFNFFNPGVSTTDIKIKESGVYSIDVSVLINSAGVLAPLLDLLISLEINGSPTAYNSSGSSGNGFFILASEYKLSAVVRMAQGDVLRVRAKHSDTVNTFASLPPGFAAKQGSHLSLVYLTL